ncbi:MAG: hypothetical protein HC932_05845 [Thermales bacterium]|nr:hypothetical protein [Thermales bacterium]
MIVSIDNINIPVVAKVLEVNSQNVTKIKATEWGDFSNIAFERFVVHGYDNVLLKKMNSLEKYLNQRISDDVKLFSGLSEVVGQGEGELKIVA